MKASPDCYPCFFVQALKTARLVTQDEKDIEEIVKTVSRSLPNLDFRVTPSEIGLEVYRTIAEITGIDDPYREVKKECTRQALELYPRLKLYISASDDRLLAAVKVAIAGNVIDFGTSFEFDLESELDAVLCRDFAVDDSESFLRTLGTARNVLYIGDNAGETVFDRLLIEEMKKPVTYVVREKPIINDAVKEDAIEAGIGELASILSSGCAAPSIILEECSPEFIERFRSADLVISKGQGNYEGLSDESGPIFFLLKVKCGVVSRHIGVPQGNIVLMEAKD